MSSLVNDEYHFTGVDGGGGGGDDDDDGGGGDPSCIAYTCGTSSTYIHI